MCLFEPVLHQAAQIAIHFSTFQSQIYRRTFSRDLFTVTPQIKESLKVKEIRREKSPGVELLTIRSRVRCAATKAPTTSHENFFNMKLKTETELRTAESFFPDKYRLSILR